MQDGFFTHKFEGVEFTMKYEALAFASMVSAREGFRLIQVLYENHLYTVLFEMEGRFSTKDVQRMVREISFNALAKRQNMKRAIEEIRNPRGDQQDEQ